MIHINAVPLDFEPRRKILSQLPKTADIHTALTLMTEFDMAFLCGALKTFRPKKVLEIGVAGGGSTVVTLQALEDLGEPYEMHSVDLSPNFLFVGYTDKPIGFAATLAKEKIFGELHGTHEFHIGKVLAQVIDEIGGGIDLVILDTMHILPGEVLDFIAVLPYLKVGSVVVLHDVALNQYRGNASDHATGVLFSSVTAEKFLNFVSGEVNSKFLYPNISAFRINEQTAANIENVFLSFVLRWSYIPSQREINIYRAHYQKHYPPQLCAIYNEAIKMNLYNMVIGSYA